MEIVALTRKNICDHGTSLKHLSFKAATDCQRTRLPFFSVVSRFFFVFFTWRTSQKTGNSRQQHGSIVPEKGLEISEFPLVLCFITADQSRKR